MSVAGVIGKTVLGAGAIGAGCFAYGCLYEVNAYALRRIEVPILPRGARPIRVLQVSDLHLTPRNTKRVEWVSRLAGLEPDLVIDTGDNLSHPEAVPVVTAALGRLLDKPGLFVWGSNDYLRTDIQESPRLSDPAEPDGWCPQAGVALGRVGVAVRASRLG